MPHWGTQVPHLGHYGALSQRRSALFEALTNAHLGRYWACALVLFMVHAVFPLAVLKQRRDAAYTAAKQKKREEKGEGAGE